MGEGRGQSDPRATPAMRQYFSFKEKHPGCVLLFRMGDFYETFDDDAVTISKALGLTLTQRTEGLPMAGVPYHQLENYLRRLIGLGFRVAVADQLQDAKEAKGLVERGVVRVLTPGTLVDDALLDDATPNTLAAVCFLDAGELSRAAVAVIEASTGAFEVADCDGADLADELARRGVTELLYAATADEKAPPRVQRVLAALGLSGTMRPAWQFRVDEARKLLLDHFGVKSLAGFGLSDDDPAVPAAGAVLAYLRHTQTLEDEAPAKAGVKRPKGRLTHVRPPRREDPRGFCVIDAVSLRSLEIERTIRAGGQMAAQRPADSSLLGTLLSTPEGIATPMGKRLLREWLCRPLADAGAIAARQRCVAALVSDRRSAAELRAALDGVQDVARIAGRVALDRATPRDLVALGRSIGRITAIQELVNPAPAFAVIAARIGAVAAKLLPLSEYILGRCVDSPPPHLREGGLIRSGVDAALDEARTLETDAGSFLAAYQERLSKELGVPGLKVGYNKVFGYYIEMTAAQARQSAGRESGGNTTLLRKQTLKNAERFTTEELAELEAKITSAQARALEREKELFEDLCRKAAGLIAEAGEFGAAAAELDVYVCLASRAQRRGWVCPEVTDGPELRIHGGRHPVLEELLGNEFVPNDLELESPARLAVLTGPNMAGKSTFIRQVALITLLAHVGSFVPADRAVIGVTDRIFTRIGADDALHAGQSTFMVEMTETANILNHVTGRSLVILDEVGRGTSTFDGLSLAWAIVEHLAGGSSPARTLFATHYHELTDLDAQFGGRIVNLHVAVREWPGTDGHPEIVFLHRIMPGRSDQSYGLHVAKLAGVPSAVIERAREVLAGLSVQHSGAAVESAVPPARSAAPADGQFSLFREYLPHPAVDRLRELKLERLSPIEAFDALRKLKETLER